MASVYSSQKYNSDGTCWWRVRADYDGSSTVKVYVEVGPSGWSMWLYLTGTCTGSAGVYYAGATYLGSVTIDPYAAYTVTETCTGGSWGQNGTLTVTVPKQKYYSYTLSLKGYLDGTSKDNITGYGTVDVAINSSSVASDVSTFSNTYTEGDTYSFSDIKATTGHTYKGVYSGSTSGTLSADTALCLNFTTNTYTIAYNANGGSGVPGNQTKTYGVNLTLSSTKPTRTGYTFLGWSRSSSATTATWAAGATLSTDLKSTQGATATLYAIWSINSYYLDLNGLLDGVSKGNISGYGKADVYVGGTLVGNQVTDYYTQHPYGTSYEIKNITTIVGHTFQGNSSYSGTIGASTTAMQLPFVTNDMQVKVGGAWKPGDTYVKVSGAWKRATAVYIKVGGTWKQING